MVEDGEFCHGHRRWLGNPVDPSYRTAIRRKSPSVPIRFLHSQGLLVGRMLDYGCGWGADADAYGMDKYDPDPQKGASDRPSGEYDTITVTYVLNALSSASYEKRRREREIRGKAMRIIESVQRLLSRDGNAYLTVRRNIRKGGEAQSLIYTDLPVVHESRDYAIYSLRKGDRRIGLRVVLPDYMTENPRWGLTIGGATTPSGDMVPIKPELIMAAIGGPKTPRFNREIVNDIVKCLNAVNSMTLSGLSGTHRYDGNIILKYEAFGADDWRYGSPPGGTRSLDDLESEVLDKWHNDHPYHGPELLKGWMRHEVSGQDNLFFAIFGRPDPDRIPRRICLIGKKWNIFYSQ